MSTTTTTTTTKYAMLTQVKLDLDKVYLNTSSENLKYRSIYGIHPEDHVDEKPEFKLEYGEEYWYLKKNGHLK